ncbi:hypothetical protein J2Z22_004306 [Paenibacillus forsythiae]|uniref:AraC family transcriptional regulator n=1 Tax=Paenibacillus forsythiae TaxID=365616 RepID=A0ABU3HD14_9BACL|nr:hypothetical protein [Paenibacillus forsythiae]MDT3428713.1 hypothetical protein [Paenibacillus forsythiae]
MGNYSRIEASLRGAAKARILILDTNNIQFYYQHERLFPQSDIFRPYDVVLIPGWVHAEYSHHEGKAHYIASIPVPTIIIEETDDYLPMLGYSDKRLMELFRVASPFSESQRFFNCYRKLEVDELSDNWIDEYYNQGFFTRQTGTLITKKNAGEVSILSLCFCLLSHYPTQIGNISIASSDFGIIALKDRILKEANNQPLELGILQSPPISFLTTDVSMFGAIKAGSLSLEQIPSLRPNKRSSLYIEYFADQTSTFHQHVVDTDSFVNICRNHEQYRIIF